MVTRVVSWLGRAGCRTRRTAPLVPRILPRVAAVGCAIASSLALPTPLSAQDAAARREFDAAIRLAVAGKGDSAMLAFTRAGQTATATGDQALAIAAARGRADVWVVFRGCADSGVRILREAQQSAPPGDRSAADALVRLLAANGDVPGARAALVAAYSDVDGVGRTITRESIAFLRGRAVNERAGGHESAALSTYNEALAIAMRLHAGDARDTANVHAVGEVTEENAWVLFDLAQLRATAKSPSIRSIRESQRLMRLVLAAWPVVADPATLRFPAVRLEDRLILRAEQCRLDGTSCPVPKPAGKC
jgi:hypothetical protein